MCECFACMTGAHRDQERPLDGPNWSYRWLKVINHVGAGNQTQSLYENKKCSKSLSHLSSPLWNIFFSEPVVG